MSSLNLDKIIEKIEGHLNVVEKARDKSYELHRVIIKKSGLSIRAVHRADKELAKQLLGEIDEKVKEANKAISGLDELPLTGFIMDAQKEYVEASVTYAIVFDEELPDPDDLGVGYAAYLKGLSEVIGELRRQILDLMRQDKGGEGEKYLQMMDEIYSILVSMDFSDAVTGGLRRATDQARGILERTRGDFTNHIVSRRMRKTIKEQMEKLPSE